MEDQIKKSIINLLKNLATLNKTLKIEYIKAAKLEDIDNSERISQKIKKVELWTLILEDIESTISEDDWELNLTTEKTVNAILFNKKYPFKSWSELLIDVCEIMILKKPYCMAQLDSDKYLNKKNSINFSFVESDILGKPKKLSNGIWVETDKQPDDILKVLYRILEICDFDKSELKIDYEG